MKVYLGKNGAGKTKFAEQQKKQGKIVLTSSLWDWRSDFLLEGKISQITISQFYQSIKSINNQLNNLLNKPENLLAWVQVKEDKKIIIQLIKDLELDQIYTQDSFWLEEKTFNQIEDFEFNNAYNIFNKFTSYKELISKLDKTTEERLLIFLKIKELFLKKKKNMDFLNENNALAQSFKLFWDQFQQEEEYLKQTDFQLLLDLSPSDLEIIKNNDIEASKEIMTNYILSNIWNSEIRLHIKDLMLELKNYKDKQISFTSLKTNKNVSNIFKQLNASFELEDNDKTIIIKKEDGFSSGQITLIICAAISYTQDDVILDDVLETMDEDNKFIFLENILESNATLLTHSTSDVKIVNQIISDNEIDNIVIKKFDSNSLVVDWDKASMAFMSYNKDFTNKDFVLLKSIFKLLSRLHAKVGTFHYTFHNVEWKVASKSSNFQHFLASSWFFHYCPKIRPNILNNFFKYRFWNQPLNSIELMQTIKNDLNQIDPSIFIPTMDIDLDKLKAFFDLMIHEMRIEKDCLEKWEAEDQINNNYENENKRRIGAFYKKLRIQFNHEQRNNSKIHSIDGSPHDFFK